MRFSRSHNKRHLGWLIGHPIAHRGLHAAKAGVVENAQPAFDRAARHGFNLELDVHLSADGGVIVFHDDTLDRLTAATGKLRHYQTAELTSLTLGGTKATIPTLEQVLELVAGRCGILVELKTETANDDQLEQAVARLLKTYAGPVAVQSFNPKTIDWFARHFPQIPRGLLAMDYRGFADMPIAQRRRMTVMANLARIRADFIGYHAKSAGLAAVQTWRRLGVPVLVWTIRTPAAQRRVMSFADNIIFEGFRP
jgi:glycerophosphoryl diester phosphodiesterase